MTYDVRGALRDAEAAKAFADHLVSGYLSPAFGARSKSEIDLLVFESLVKSGAIPPDGPVYDLARTFNITPSRARSLLMTWQLRSPDLASDLRARLVAVLAETRFAKDGTLVAFGIESPLLKEDIIARLKRKGVFPDASFSRDLVRLPVEAFVEFLDDLLDPDLKVTVRRRLVKDKQLPDRSFKALAVGVIGKLGEKVAGKAGEEIAGEVVKGASERLVGFLTGLLKGDVDEAVGAVMAGDYKPPE